ncbi:MAG: hypothetical protein ABSF60_06325 [Verrucomicrobiota bacterium]
MIREILGAFWTAPALPPAGTPVSSRLSDCSRQPASANPLMPLFYQIAANRSITQENPRPPEKFLCWMIGKRNEKSQGRLATKIAAGGFPVAVGCHPGIESTLHRFEHFTCLNCQLSSLVKNGGCSKISAAARPITLLFQDNLCLEKNSSGPDELPFFGAGWQKTIANFLPQR